MGLVRIRRIVPGLTTGLNPAINLVPRTGPGPDIARPAPLVAAKP